MNINRLTYRKKQVFRFLLAFSLVLSLFSVPGSVNLSSVQLQKNTTEFLWSEGRYQLACIAYYSNKQVPANRRESCYLARLIEQKALLACDQIFFARFNHLDDLFKAIKPALMVACGFNNFLSDKDEPAIV